MSEEMIWDSLSAPILYQYATYHARASQRRVFKRQHGRLNVICREKRPMYGYRIPCIHKRTNAFKFNNSKLCNPKFPYQRYN